MGYLIIRTGSTELDINNRLLIVTRRVSHVTLSGVNQGYPLLYCHAVQVLESSMVAAESPAGSGSETGSETRLSSVTVSSGETNEGLTDCPYLQNVLELDGKTALIAISEKNPLTYSTR